ncbi:MAG: MFS transporter [Coriobacteriia bacterium]
MREKRLMRQAWVVTLVVFLGGIALAFAQNKVAPIIPTVMDAFSIDMASAGWLSSIFSVVALITSLPAAFILARLGSRKCGIIALVCAVVGCFMGIFAGRLPLLMVSRIVEGVGVGIISVVAPALVSMWFPAEKRGLPMGVWGAWQMVAQSLTFFAGAKLTAMFGWRGLWYMGMVILVLALVLYVLKVKSPPAGHNHADCENGSYSLLEGLKVPSVWFCGISTMCFTFACFGFVNWIASYWAHAFGWSIDKANGYVSFIYLVEIFLVILVGWALNHIKNRKLIAELAHLFYAVVLFLCFRLHNPSLIIPFCFLYALAEGSIPTAFWTLIAQTVPKPELAGVSIGVLGLLQNLGMLLGPPIAGWTIQHWGWNWGSMPMVFAACLGLTFFMFVKIYPPVAPSVAEKACMYAAPPAIEEPAVAAE